MDLGTVESKLLATEAAAVAADIGESGARGVGPAPGTYSEPEEFASDMRMIWRNAFLYNKPELIVHQWAKELSIKFETWYAQL